MRAGLAFPSIALCTPQPIAKLCLGVLGWTQAKGSRAFILDLRGNPGGLVDVSVNVARLWLDVRPTLFTVNAQQVGPGKRQLAHVLDCECAKGGARKGTVGTRRRRGAGRSFRSLLKKMHGTVVMHAVFAVLAARATRGHKQCMHIAIQGIRMRSPALSE